MLVPATRWTRLEDTALSEINQSQKEKYPDPTSLIMESKFPKTESCSELIEDCGDRERGRDLSLTGTESLSEKR